jgi:hypothetical protein
MAGKKLLTLACAVGILACGACFLPPLPPPKPKPGIYLHSIRSIGVSVRNETESHHVNPSLLQQAAVMHINLLTNGIQVNAVGQGPVASDDAVLEVAIVNERVSEFPPSHPGGCRELEFQISVYATLTRKDGRVMWQETNDQQTVSACLTRAEPSDAWNDQAQQFWLMDTVGKRLAYHMFYRS